MKKSCLNITFQEEGFCFCVIFLSLSLAEPPAGVTLSQSYYKFCQHCIFFTLVLITNILVTDINLSVASICRIMHRFADAICSVKHHFIKFPTTSQEIMHNQFYSDHNIPNVVGLIDGTHIQIIAPPVNEDAYVNRLQYHSINCQVVVNHDSH